MSNIIHKSPGKQTMTAWAKKWREERRARERHREMLKHGQGRSDVEEINRMIEQAPKHKPERILVGDRGHWI